MVEAEGNTIDTYGTRQDSADCLVPASLELLLEKASFRGYAAGIFWGANPAYTFPKEPLWKKAMAGLPESFRIGMYEDETALDCSWRLPEHHWLESWGDFDSGRDFISLRQPTVGALHDTRQGEDLLLSWLRGIDAQTPQNYFEYLKARWRSHVYPAGSPVDFDTYWNAALHDGGVEAMSNRNSERFREHQYTRSSMR